MRQLQVAWHDSTTLLQHVLHVQATWLGFTKLKCKAVMQYRDAAHSSREVGALFMKLS